MAVLKKEFIDRMAEIGGITKKEAKRGVELFIETLTDFMAEDEKVMIKGFGRFEMKVMKERKGWNLQTGESCIVPEHKKMRFSPSDLLADRIKELQRED